MSGPHDPQPPSQHGSRNRGAHLVPRCGGWASDHLSTLHTCLRLLQLWGYNPLLGHLPCKKMSVMFALLYAMFKWTLQGRTPRSKPNRNKSSQALEDGGGGGDVWVHDTRVSGGGQREGTVNIPSSDRGTYGVLSECREGEQYRRRGVF